jgi:hypothetical protein
MDRSVFLEVLGIAFFEVRDDVLLLDVFERSVTVGARNLVLKLGSREDCREARRSRRNGR